MGRDALRYLIGIDMGTTNVKALLFDEQGNTAGEARCPSPITLLPDGGGVFDPEELWRLCCRLLTELLDAVPAEAWSRLAGLAVTGMGEAGVPLDAAGQPLYPVIAWFDPRTEQYPAWWRDTFGEDRLYAVTGLKNQHIFTANKLLWLKEHEPRVFGEMRRWHCIPDYIAFRLTGASAMDLSLATRTLLLDAASGSLGGVSGTLAAYADAVAAAQPTLASGITLAQSVSGYLADMEEDVRRVTDSAAFRRFIELMESDSDSMADYLASPVQMNTEIIYEIKDYGAAMSPYYVMLALFVGSLLTAVMVKVPVTQPEFLNCRGIERYFGRFLTFFCMAMAQALVTAFGCLWFVGMETAEPALFVLACCLCSLNFAAMNYALVYSLDNVGLAASVIIMVLQVAGSGGSYPIDVLPALFRRLYPFMPFHYGMDMLRETIGGLYGHTYLRCALILLGMCVLFTVFGLLVYYPARRLNAAIAASKEKSGIM